MKRLAISVVVVIGLVWLAWMVDSYYYDKDVNKGGYIVTAKNN